ncbi:hypothetical protein FXN63_01645 [Pigmentiphaga aceris]|uniref:Outer membrane protein beta-barrel domain-containing protein n=2 Tax=Pigmentiphaga aceris TaxID=1940612 RepID=A0A5C0B393_9BURK|nr:hypothetical protein FXN63_01645 [Pigmentiphaga aceris]
MALLAGSSLCPLAPVFAAGGAHVVEDSEVEEPGRCHVDSWVSRQGGRDGGITLSPACTSKAMPDLEFSAAVQRNWGSSRDTLVGPGFKYNFMPEAQGVGLALAGSGAWSTRDGHFDNALLVVPLTLRLHEDVRVNLNAGWSYTHGRGRKEQAFLGAQVEYAVASDVSLMAEVFGRDGDPMGSQLGVRWTPGGGDVDVDLLYGRRLDGSTPRTVTLGVTFRY